MLKLFRTALAVQILAAVVCLALTVGLTVFVGGWAYRTYSHWAFGNYAVSYHHKVERATAYAVYDLAKPSLSEWEKTSYEERLVKLEDKFQHPLREAIHNVTDPDFLSRKDDYFDTVLTDIRFLVRGNERFSAVVRDRVEKLCLVQGQVSCVAWPFICEDLGLYHNGEAMPYAEVIKLKAELSTLEPQMATLLASK